MIHTRFLTAMDHDGENQPKHFRVENLHDFSQYIATPFLPIMSVEMFVLTSFDSMIILK